MLKVTISLSKEVSFFILEKHEKIELVINENELGTVMEKVDALAAAIYGRTEDGRIKANPNHGRSDKVKNMHWASYIGYSKWLDPSFGNIMWNISVNVEWFHYQIRVENRETGESYIGAPMNSIKSVKKIHNIRRHLEMNGYTTHGDNNTFMAVKDCAPTLRITRETFAMLYDRKKKSTESKSEKAA